MRGITQSGTIRHPGIMTFTLVLPKFTPRTDNGFFLNKISIVLAGPTGGPAGVFLNIRRKKNGYVTALDL